MKGLLGSLLLVAGVLIAGASGLCVLLGAGDFQNSNWPVVLFNLGIPFLIGIGLLALGIAIIRSAGSKDPQD